MLLPLEIASGTPYGSLVPFRCSRKRIPEVGLDQERFLGGRRKAVERTVLQAEEAQWLQGLQLLCCIAKARGRHLQASASLDTHMLSPGMPAGPGP